MAAEKPIRVVPAVDGITQLQEFKTEDFVAITDGGTGATTTGGARTQLGVDEAGVKTLYEDNADTNAYTDAEKAKLSSVESSAQNNTGANVGTGEDVFKQKAGSTLEFRRLQDGTNTQSRTDGDSVAVDVVGGAGSGLDADTLDGVEGSGYATSGHGHSLDDLSDVDAAAPTDGQVLTWIDSESEWEPRDNASGAGDMLAATYDPGAVADDAFDMDNMVEGTTTKILTDVERAKLAGIETGATADQSASEIKVAYESNADTNAYDDAAVSKLAGIEAGATADQSAGEIKTAYESNADTNVFDDAAQSKLAGIEAGATGDLTAGEIKTLYESNADTNEFSDAEQTNLANAALKGSANTFTAENEWDARRVLSEQTKVVVTADAATIDFANGPVQYIDCDDVTGDTITLSFTNMSGGRLLYLHFEGKAASGTPAITKITWPAEVKWVGVKLPSVLGEVSVEVVRLWCKSGSSVYGSFDPGATGTPMIAVDRATLGFGSLTAGPGQILGDQIVDTDNDQDVGGNKTFQGTPLFEMAPRYKVKTSLSSGASYTPNFGGEPIQPHSIPSGSAFTMNGGTGFVGGAEILVELINNSSVEVTITYGSTWISAMDMPTTIPVGGRIYYRLLSAGTSAGNVIAWAYALFGRDADTLEGADRDTFFELAQDETVTGSPLFEKALRPGIDYHTSSPSDSVDVDFTEDPHHVHMPENDGTAITVTTSNRTVNAEKWLTILNPAGDNQKAITWPAWVWETPIPDETCGNSEEPIFVMLHSQGTADGLVRARWLNPTKDLSYKELDRKFAEYVHTAAAAVSSSWATVFWQSATLRDSTVFSNAPTTSTIQVDEDGWVRIHGNIDFECTTGAGGIDVLEYKLEHSTDGSSWTTLLTKQEDTNAALGGQERNSAFEYLHQAGDGDEYRIRHRRFVGSSTWGLKSTNTRINFELLRHD